MKILITLDPSVVECYALRESKRFPQSVHVAIENTIKKQDGDMSVFGRLLFNRPEAVKVEVL